MRQREKYLKINGINWNINCTVVILYQKNIDRCESILSFIWHINKCVPHTDLSILFEVDGASAKWRINYSKQ